MPKEFVFKVDGHEQFRKRLYTGRCEGITRTGHRCKRKSIIGYEYCPAHLQMVDHLKIQTSNIPQAEKGLFAVDKTKGPNDIVFRKGDPIVPYNGEIISPEELDRRYGLEDITAPYALGITQDPNFIIDAAAKRGIGSMANYMPGHNNAKFVTHVRNHHPQARIKATKNIRNNQEIYVDYKRDYRLNEPGVEFYTKNVRG